MPIELSLNASAALRAPSEWCVAACASSQRSRTSSPVLATHRLGGVSARVPLESGSDVYNSVSNECQISEIYSYKTRH